MKKAVTMMLSLTLVFAALFVPMTVHAAETTVTDGAVNLRWSDDLLCTWDIGTNPKVNGTDVYGVNVCLESSTDGSSFSKRGDHWFTGAAVTSCDYRNEIASRLSADKYFRFKIGYYLTYDGTTVAYSEYSDVLDLSAATVYDRPADVRITDTTVSWKEVSGVDTYSVIVRGVADLYKKTTVTHDPSCNIATELAEAQAAGELTVEIMVIAGNIETEYTKTTTKFPSRMEMKYASLQNIYVGGVLVTESNKHDILGDGTASYDFETKTLTLKNANITNHLDYYFASYGIDSTYDALNIVLIGDNTLSLTNLPPQFDDAYGIYSDGDFTISGPGSLTINTEAYGYIYQYAIWANKKCTIKDATINIAVKGRTSLSSGFIAYGDTVFDNVRMNVDTRAVQLEKGNRVGDFRVPDHTVTLNGNSVVNVHTKSPDDEYTISVAFGDLVMNAGCLNIQSEETVHMKYSGEYVLAGSELAENAQVFEPDRVMLSSSKLTRTVTNATCTKAGYTTASCPVCGESMVSDETPAKGHSYTTKVVTKATQTTAGKTQEVCKDCGKIKSTATIAKVSTIKLATTSYTYDGKVKSPVITVKDSAGKALVKGTDYTVTVPTGRKTVGKYTYKVTLKGAYSGSKSLSMTIKPKKAVIQSLTPGSKRMTVKLSTKVSSTGGSTYQIQYRLAGTSNWKSTTTTAQSKTIGSLLKAKKYQVRVRAYKTVNGTKYYGAWSTTKTVTTK